MERGNKIVAWEGGMGKWKGEPYCLVHWEIFVALINWIDDTIQAEAERGVPVSYCYSSTDDEGGFECGPLQSKTSA